VEILEKSGRTKEGWIKREKDENGEPRMKERRQDYRRDGRMEEERER